MATRRITHHAPVLRPLCHRSTIRPFSTTLIHHQKDTQQTAADGASDKTPQNAQPKILNTKPPQGSEQSQEVAEHNKNHENRQEKLTGKEAEKEAENDKVSKDFWKGTGGEGGM